MQFVGYGSPAYLDYLVYPTTSAGDKIVKFTVDSSQVNTHSLQGAGFLINTGIDDSGYIKGYLLYYAFNSPTSVSSITLYKINDNVLATTLNGNYSSITSNCSTIGTISNSVSWSTVMNIKLEIGATSVKVSQKASTEEDYTEVGTDNSLTTTGFYGFGPFVHYQSHNCQLVSAFRFSDLEMTFAQETNSVLDAIQYSNYLDNSEKYFVNLLANGSTDTPTNDDWEGLARLRQDEIYYVTNVTNPFLNDGGVVDTEGGEVAPNGSNGITITDSSDTDELVDSIVQYIIQQKSWDDDNLPTLQVTTPVSIFSVAAKPDGTNDEQVLEVLRNYVGEDGLVIYANDKSVAGKDGESADTITERKYTIYKPDGTTATITGDTSGTQDTLITITPSSPLGTYTVIQTVTNSSDVSANSTVTFQVSSDSVAPTVTFTTPSDTSSYTTSAPYTGGSVSLDFSDSGEGVMAYAMGKKGPTDTEVAYGDETDLDQAVSFMELDHSLDAGEYTLYVKVWDKAGNSKVVTLPVNAKMIQTLTGATTYNLVAGEDESVALNIETNNTEDGAGISYQILSSSPAGAATLENGIVTAQKRGTVTVRATAAETTSYRAATKDITINIGTPLAVSINVADFTSSSVQLTPSYTLGGYPIDNSAAVFQYREASSSVWNSFTSWGWNTPSTLQFADLKADTDYIVSLTASDTRAPTAATAAKTISFHTPAASSTATGTAQIEVTGATISEDYSISICQGNTIIDNDVYTPSSGTFTASFTGLKDGYYNFVIEDGDGNVTTQMIQVKDGLTVGSPSVTVSAKNTRVQVMTEDTPEIAVGGLDDILTAESENNDSGITAADNTIIDAGGSVEIKLTVQSYHETDSEISNDVTLIKTISSSQKLPLFLDLSLYKTITEADALSATQTKLVESPGLLTIAIPFAGVSGRNLTVYRVHNDISSVIPQTPSVNEDGEYCEFVTGYVILHVKNFSTYAIGYTPYTSTSTTTKYAVTVSTSSTGGTISPTSVNVSKNGSQTFTITPDEGYIISDVLVDGVSVGAVNSYTIEHITANHSIQAIFTKAEEQSGLPYYLNSTGDKVFIGFSSDTSGTMKYLAPDGETVMFIPNPKDFSDIANNWAKSSIDFVTEREIFVGTGSNVFAPNSGMTRGMFATVIGRLYERSFGALATDNANHTFTDVNYSDYYGAYIDWAAENGIIAGVGRELYEPDREITRQEMATILYRFAAYLDTVPTEMDSELTYPDASEISEWAKTAALYCQGTGIITGRGNKDFDPDGTATRAEVATILQRFIELTVN